MSDATKNSQAEDRVWGWANIGKIWGCTGQWLSRKHAAAGPSDPIRSLIALDSVLDRPFAYRSEIDAHLKRCRDESITSAKRTRRRTRAS